jgi:hypothetical protein
MQRTSVEDPDGSHNILHFRGPANEESYRRNAGEFGTASPGTFTDVVVDPRGGRGRHRGGSEGDHAADPGRRPAVFAQNRPPMLR